jgi:hypothetical protein
MPQSSLARLAIDQAVIALRCIQRETSGQSRAPNK